MATRLGLNPSRPALVERSWYDTFDRRLWSRGWTLEAQRPTDTTGPFAVTLRDRTSYAAHWVSAVPTLPSLAGDLPEGPWRRSLGRVIGIRALVPVASHRLSTARVPVTDAEGKVVAEVLWEQVQADRATAPTVRVVPLRGYDADARTVAARLARELSLPPLATHPLEVAAGPIVVPPSGLGVVLDPARPTGEAIRLLLRSLWDAMEVVEPWLGAPPDTEFLHDYRVALRRSRSVLKQARHVVAPTVLGDWRARLRDLQRRTNLARDLDVFLLEWPAYLAMTADDIADDLKPLHVLLRTLRDEEQVQLAGYLTSTEHQDVREAYGTLLATALPSVHARLAMTPTREVAATRIRSAYRRVIQGGRAITPESPATDLHELRILGKELRYALELFGSLLEPAALGPLVKELKQLQDNLGEHQDSEVHATQLRTFADRLGEAGGRTETFVAVGLLIHAFSERQAAARREFADRFTAFSAPGPRAQVGRLLASLEKGGKR